MVTIFFLFCLMSCSIIQCPEGNCEQRAIISEQVPPINDVSDQVDVEVRRQFWYYIRKSDTVYTASIDTGLEYLFFNIYQNKIGTFMSIAGYNFKSLKTNVRTMIRLGDGISNKPNNKLTVDPFFLQITVQNQSYVVEIDERGILSVNDQVFQITVSQSGSTIDSKITDQDVEKIDKYIRNLYWYYIQGATRTKFEKVNMSLRKYVLITYNHKTGLYLAVANMNNQSGQIELNTFVRLGEYQEPKVQDNYDEFQVFDLQAFGIVPIFIG